ncbi:protein of unknown function [Mesotoga infera]|uniref:Uncharacterized protein n=1 Tax=Mesotoga infera TaxID=1236046 RepID=A0A7Z7PNY8_9BACT|nr:protein of unknown function [Mesotoga infera]
MSGGFYVAWVEWAGALFDELAGFADRGSFYGLVDVFLSLPGQRLAGLDSSDRFSILR